MAIGRKLLPTGVRYVSALPGSGYGDSAEHYIAGLRSRVPVTWTATGDPAGFGIVSTHGDILGIDIPYDTVVLHVRPEEMPPWFEVEPDRVRIGYIAWEADRAPADWRVVLDQLDLALVPSTFNQQAVAEVTTTPVAVLPHVARRVMPRPDHPFGEIDDDDYVFYTIGTWHNRKALPETVRTFLDTFTKDDAVALIVKTTALDYAALGKLRSGQELEGGSRAAMSWWSLAQIMRDYPQSPKVFLHAADATQEAIDEIHTRGDCYVSLARGEGWGLGSFDAASFGKPSIVTGWGGPLDYLGTDYPLLVNYALVPTSTEPPDAYGFPGSDDARWARADLAHAGVLMRHVYEHREDAVGLGAELRARVVDKYAPAVVTSHLIRLVAETHDRVRP